MNTAAGGESAALRQFYTQSNWPQLGLLAERVARATNNAEAWRYWGIAELMQGQLRGPPDKLLRAAALTDLDAPVWLHVMQEFASYPRGSVGMREIRQQVDLEGLRRSRYMDYPSTISFETLALCNAECVFCPYPTMDRKGDRMPDELIDKIIDDMRQIPRDVPFNVAPFKVNEPFLDKRIFSVCERINQILPHARLRLFTNGTPLVPAMLDKIAALKNVGHLWISLNEVDAEAYRKLMNLPLDRTLQKLDLLHEALRDKNFPHQVQVSRVADFSPRDQAFISFVQQRYPLFHIFMITPENWTGQVTHATERPAPALACTRWYELSIMASGKVALCCMDGEGKHVIGDVNTQSVLEVYNAPAFRKMRQFSFTRKGAAAPCDTCSYS